MDTYFAKVVERHVQERPDHIAYESGNQVVSWKQYNEDINRMTNSFLKLGLKHGDKIVTILPQTPAFMTVFMAAANMGLIVVPLDPRLKAMEMAALCLRTEPKMLVAMANEGPLRTTIESLLKEVEIPRVFSYAGDLAVPRSQPYDVLLDASSESITKELHPAADDPLLIIFTSGSTGTPKGAMLTHRNTFAMAKATMNTWKLSSDDRILMNLPTSHVGGTHDQIAVQLYAGATGVLMSAFHPEETLRFVSRYKITMLGGVPTMFRLIFQHCKIEEHDVSSLRLIFLGGEPSPPELIARINRDFPNATVVASWGMTETAGFFTFTELTDGVEIISETEGKAGPGNQIRILKADGTVAKSNEVGEMLVRGESVIRGYLDKENNNGAFLDGWLKTGDLGYLDEKNYLHYVGRSKEMYISGGYNVYPLEIESFLNAHPSVNASCIIEVPDETWGEVGIAFIVPEEGVTLDGEELLLYCKNGLADYKRPRKFFIRKDLPKTSVGKIAKQEIRGNLASFLSELRS